MPRVGIYLVVNCFSTLQDDHREYMEKSSLEIGQGNILVLQTFNLKCLSLGFAIHSGHLVKYSVTVTLLFQTV